MMAKVTLKPSNSLNILYWGTEKKTVFRSLCVLLRSPTQPQTKGLDNATIAIFRCHTADHTTLQAPSNKSNSTDQRNRLEVRMQLFSDGYRGLWRHANSITLIQLSLTPKDYGSINQFFPWPPGQTGNEHPLLFLRRKGGGDKNPFATMPVRVPFLPHLSSRSLVMQPWQWKQ